MYAIRKLVAAIALVVALPYLVVYLVLRHTQIATRYTQRLHDKLYTSMALFHSHAETHGVSYFIIGGSLLGAVRSRSIIPHDDDIDIAILDSDLSRLQNSLKDHDNLNLESFTEGMYKLRHKEYPTAFIDVFTMYRTDAGTYEFVPAWARRCWPMYWFHAFEMSQRELCAFGDLMVYRPPRELSIEYLQRSYGHDWQIPKFTHAHHWLVKVQHGAAAVMLDAVLAAIYLSMYVTLCVLRAKRHSCTTTTTTTTTATATATTVCT